MAQRRAQRAQRETSAGGVVFRRDPEGRVHYLLIRDSYRNWGFPKGHLEPGEPPADAARREVAEETGLADLILHGPIRVIDWYFRFRGKTIHKYCHFFLFESRAGRSGAAEGGRHYGVRLASSGGRTRDDLVRQRPWRAAPGGGNGARAGGRERRRGRRRVMPVIPVCHQRREARRALARGYPRRLGVVRACGTPQAVLRLVAVRLVDAIVVDVKSRSGRVARSCRAAIPDSGLRLVRVPSR